VAAQRVPPRWLVVIAAPPLVCAPGDEK